MSWYHSTFTYLFFLLTGRRFFLSKLTNSWLNDGAICLNLMVGSAQEIDIQRSNWFTSVNNKIQNLVNIVQNERFNQSACQPTVKQIKKTEDKEKKKTLKKNEKKKTHSQTRIFIYNNPENGAHWPRALTSSCLFRWLPLLLLLRVYIQPTATHWIGHPPPRAHSTCNLLSRNIRRNTDTHPDR